jgi:hypothetical protein
VTEQSNAVQVKAGSYISLPGESAFQIWLDAGNTGTMEDFLASLKGEPGEPGTAVVDVPDLSILFENGLSH